MNIELLVHQELAVDEAAEPKSEWTSKVKNIIDTSKQRLIALVVKNS